MKNTGIRLFLLLVFLSGTAWGSAENPFPIFPMIEAVERHYTAAIDSGSLEGDREARARNRELFERVISGLKANSPEGISDFGTFVEHLRSRTPPELFAFEEVVENLSARLQMDLSASRNMGKSQEVLDRIESYLHSARELESRIALEKKNVAHRETAPQKMADFQPRSTPNTGSCFFDRVRNLFRNLLGKTPVPRKVWSTDDAVRKVVQLVTDKITDPFVPLDCGLGNRRVGEVGGEDLHLEEIPHDFTPSTNNSTEQFAQGAGFAKIAGLVERVIRNRRNGNGSGVFIFVHNFILSGDPTGVKMADLFISARHAGVPVLLSYDRFGTLVYDKGGEAQVERMRNAGIGIGKTAIGQRMDHRKIYFFGTGDGHVIALAGGQGWCEKYSGNGWENLEVVSEKEGTLLYPAGKEPWLDHMRLLDGEAAYQGAVNFLGMFAANADKEALRRGLGILEYDDPGKVSPRLSGMISIPLAPAGKIEAVILNNVTWDRRPITEKWYQGMGNPDFGDVRIVQPYITDPVFRNKLRELVGQGRNLKILIPGSSDACVAQWATKYLLADLETIREKLIQSGKRAGKLEFREWRTADGTPQMVHMKIGIFINGTNPKEDFVIDGSYNATAVEARSMEKNADILVTDHRAAVEAAEVFDGYFERGAKMVISDSERAKGMATTFILRPFL